MSGMYWYAVAASDDVAGLKNKGFCVTSDGEILYNEQYEYALARMYTSDGHGIVDVETSNFFFDKDSSDRITINAEDPMTTPVLSYKLRMTDQYPDAEWFYFAADKSEEILEDGVPHPLYKSDGTLATKTDYADCEFEALNPMPSEFFGMYGRFTTATFSFATYQSTADVLHVEFTGLHQEEDEYCFADRLRVVVTASPAPYVPMGGVLTSTSDSVIRVPVEQAGGVIEVYVPYLDILFGVYWKWTTSEWIAYPLEQSNPKYSNIISQSDRDSLVAFGLTYSTGSPYITSGFGAVNWSSSFSFEPIGVYADIEGTQLMPDDMSEYTCRETNHFLTIDKLTTGYGSTVKAWKCRIRRNTQNS